MEIADPSEATAPAWGTFLLHRNLQLPALIGLVCYPWPQMGPHLYASSWPIHRSLLALLTLRPVPPPPLPSLCPLLHPWARSGLCHNKPLPSSHPGKPVGGVQLPPTPVCPAQVSPLSLGLQAADGGAAPAHALVTRGSTGLSQTLEVRPPGGAQHPTGVPSTLFIVPLPP